MSFSSYVPTLAPEERHEPRLGPRVWAGAILMGASLGFVLLAGCFAIGVLMVLNPSSLNGAPPPPGTTISLAPEEVTFVVALYVLAGLSMLAAAVLFCVGLVGLVRILYGKTASA